jgi:hypothetical protein
MRLRLIAARDAPCRARGAQKAASLSHKPNSDAPSALTRAMETLAPRAQCARPTAAARPPARCESSLGASTSSRFASVQLMRRAPRRVRLSSRAGTRAGPETETEGSPLDFPEARAASRQLPAQSLCPVLAGTRGGGAAALLTRARVRAARHAPPRAARRSG